MSQGRSSRRSLLSLALLSIVTVSCATPISEFVHQQGYSDYRPPSTLMPPGTIVFVDAESGGTLGIVCTAKGALGEMEPMPSDTVDVVRQMQKKGKFTLDASYLEQAKASFGVSGVKEVRLDFTNPRVLALSDEMVFAAVQNRSVPCKRALEAAVHVRKVRPAMVREVIRADVVYRVKYESSVNLSAEAKLAAMKSLAAALQADASTATEETVRGTGLFWGFRGDPYLATVTGAPASIGGRGTRAPPPDSIPAVLFSVDPRPLESLPEYQAQ